MYTDPTYLIPVAVATADRMDSQTGERCVSRGPFDK